MWRAIVLLALVTTLGCGRAIDRPLRGAAPGTEAPATAGVPPTLSPSDALRFRPLASPSPGVDPSPAANASPSPAANASPSAVPLAPIVRTIAPAAQAHVPPSAPVALQATLVGRTADLAMATLTVDNGEVGAQTDKRSAREWTIRASKQLPPGPHTARVQVRDAAGTPGGFTWQFVVDDNTPE
jgi:hypothetical protein